MEVKLENFRLPQQLEDYKKAIKELARTELAAIADEMEATFQVPDRLLPLLRKAGLLKLRIPKQYGGVGLNFSQYWPILAEVAKPHGTIRMFVHGMNGMWVMIHTHGTEEQKKKYIPRWVEGKGFPAFALTEPDTGTGRDIKTTARKDGDKYIVNGTKHLITYADIADMFHTPVYTGDRALGAKGTSMLLIERDTPGFTIEPHEEMIGIRGCYHGILHFKDCPVPAANLLGKEGEGLDIALRTMLDPSRLSIAVSCFGPMEHMLELSRDFAHTRVTFGKPIADRQVVQQMLADMAVDIYALKCMITDCARQYDEGQLIPVEASICKLFGLLAVRRVSDLALEIHGGIGVSKAYTIERTYRDVRPMTFEEGTPTIQRMVIGRDVLGRPPRSIGK